MIADGQPYLTTKWELATFPGFAVVLTGPRAGAHRRRPRRSPATGMTDTILRVRDLRVEFPLARGVVRAVDGASFTLAAARRSGWSASPAPARR